MSPTPRLAAGQYQLRESGRTGYYAAAYRTYYKGDQVVRTEELSSSHYKRHRHHLRRGPGHRHQQDRHQQGVWHHWAGGHARSPPRSPPPPPRSLPLRRSRIPRRSLWSPPLCRSRTPRRFLRNPPPSRWWRSRPPGGGTAPDRDRGLTEKNTRLWADAEFLCGSPLA